MRKERFLAQRHSKLLPRGDGRFQVIERINDNAYKLKFPNEYNVSASFYIFDLSPFDIGDDSRTNPFHGRGNNENKGATPKDLLHVSVGPIVRARLKGSKKHLMGSIQETWADSKLVKSKIGPREDQGLVKSSRQLKELGNSWRGRMI
ncbi:hypothetical protein TorRG33x02_346050, partial [Trema orientale]